MGLKIALRALALAALLAVGAAQLVPTNQPAFTQQASLGNASIYLAPGSPQFTFWSDADAQCSAVAGGGGAPSCVPTHWLSVALRDVYEVDAAGQRVPQRSGSAVLDATGLQWKAEELQAGSPAVPVYSAAMRIPMKPSLPPCAGGAAAATATPGPAPAPGPSGAPGGSVTLAVQLWGGLTNITVLNASLELLPGNVKWAVTADGWPFCDPSHSLVLDFALLPASSDQGAVVREAAELAAVAATQQAQLTGAADPASVPVADAGEAPPPDPALAGPEATAVATQSVGRRRLLKGGRGGGSRGGGSSSKPAPTRPDGPAPGGTPTVTGTPLRTYFPNGGTSRPRYPTPAAALSSLPFAASQRPFLASRFYFGRPVYGFGRPFLFPYTAFLFFAATSGARHRYAPAVSVQRLALLNNETLVNVTVTTPRPDSKGVQSVLVTIPYYQGSMYYDPVAAITDSDLDVTNGIQTAINEAMAYDSAGVGATGDAPPSAAPRTLRSYVALLAAGLVGLAAAVL